MNKVVSICCLLLMTAIPVAVWAATCCPPEHDMDMRPAEDCLVPATQAASASAALNSFTEESNRQLVGDALATRHDVVAESRTPGPPAIGGPSPGISQTSPVLLR